MAEEQLVVLRLGKEEYAIHIAHVKEIIQYKGATKIPNAPTYMEGIINLRGKVIPVIDLAAKFGVAINQGLDKRVVIIEAAGQEIGLVVDEVSEVIRLQESAIEASPTIAGNSGFIRGIGKEADRLLILLDVEKLFSVEEREELNK